MIRLVIIEVLKGGEINILTAKQTLTLQIFSFIEDPLARVYRRRLKMLKIDRGIPVALSIEKPLPKGNVEFLILNRKPHVNIYN